MHDFRIELEVSRGNGGIAICAHRDPVTTPDEDGYLIFFSRSHAILKRNANEVCFGNAPGSVRKIALIKEGITLKVEVNGKKILEHVDDIPFYSDYRILDRFALYARDQETFKKIQIQVRKNLFDYEQLAGLRKLVRFKRDERRSYEMQIIPGEYRNQIKKFLFMREYSELARTQERMSTYKKERDQAIMQLSAAQKGFHGLLGSAPAMENIFQTISAVAGTNTSLLITGETGTGKDLAAQAVHDESGRKGPFVKVDCAALPATLIESELFGHEKGAFTGADSRKIGRFEQAHGGTLFLDEIGNLTPELQMKLLRFLQDRRFERLGGKETLESDVRVISATNTDLERAVKSGSFRADLFYRIRVVAVHMPPLRDRLMDVYPLVNNLIVKLAHRNRMPIPHIQNDVFPLLLQYHWPGNVRELNNVIEHAMVTSDRGIITVEFFPDYIKTMLTKDKESVITETQKPEQAEAREKKGYRDRKTFLRVFEKYNGNVYKTASHFNCSHMTVKRYIGIHGLKSAKEFELERALQELNHKSFTVREFMEVMDVSMPTARKYLERLIRKKKITKNIRGRRLSFQVNPP
jgi:transcriptional regulator with PAS, ATPase and Fis domain